MQVDPRHPLVPLNDLQISQLLADLNIDRVKLRDAPGNKSKKMSYLEGWDIRATLTRIFGFGGWSYVQETEGTKILRFDHDVPQWEFQSPEDFKAKRPKVQKQDEEGNALFNWRVTAQCTATLYIHQLGQLLGGVAIASQTGNDPGDVADFAMKTAETDALKRAAMNLGTQFGLSLYKDGQLNDVIIAVKAPGQLQIDRVEMELDRKEASARRTKSNAERLTAMQQGGQTAAQASGDDVAPKAREIVRVAPAELDPADPEYVEPTPQPAPAAAVSPAEPPAGPPATTRAPRGARAQDEDLRAQEAEWEAQQAAEARAKAEQAFMDAKTATPQAAPDPEPVVDDTPAVLAADSEPAPAPEPEPMSAIDQAAAQNAAAATLAAGFGVRPS